MDTKKISMLSVGALLALTSAAWAGPMPVASEKVITPETQIGQVHYRYGRYRYHRYGWHRGWHYGWHRGGHYGPHYGWHPYRRYAYYPYYRYPYYGYRYGYYGPAGAAANVAGTAVGGALGLAALPFAWATGGWPYYGYGYPYRYRYPYYW